jgi:uncharacterized membrane protein YfcA
LPPDLTELLIITLVVTVGTTVQGSVGFGWALLSTPFLVLMDPLFVPGPVLLASFMFTVATAIRERQSVDVSGVGWAIAGRVPGTVLGAFALSVMSSRVAPIVIASLLLAAVIMTASRVRLAPTRGTLLSAGVLSGFMGTTCSVGGPPIALVYQREKGSRIRSTLSSYFVLGSSLSIAALWFIGRFGLQEIRAAALLIPGLTLGFLLSHSTRQWLDRGYTRPAVLLVAGVAALLVLVRSL